MAAGAVLIGANIGALIAASESNVAAAQDGSISWVEAALRELLLLGGVILKPRFAVVTDTVILGTDIAAPAPC